MNKWYIVFRTPPARRPNHGRNRHHRSIPDTGPAFGHAAAVTDAARTAHPARIADPQGISTNGDKKLDGSERSSVIRSSGSAIRSSGGAVDGAQMSGGANEL